MIRQLYVIMPVASDPEYPAKRTAIESVANELGYEPFFPLDRGNLFDLEATLMIIQSVELVLADLTLERPRCYYELGLAQSLKKRAVLIALAGTPIHQSANRTEVLFYNDIKDYCHCLARALQYK